MPKISYPAGGKIYNKYKVKVKASFEPSLQKIAPIKLLLILVVRKS